MKTRITNRINSYLSIFTLLIVSIFYFYYLETNFHKNFIYDKLVYINDKKEVNEIKIKNIPIYSEEKIASRIKKVSVRINNFHIKDTNKHYKDNKLYFTDYGETNLKNHFEKIIEKYAPLGYISIEYAGKNWNPVLISKRKFNSNKIIVYNFYHEGIFKFKSLDEKKDITIESSSIITVIDDKRENSNGVTIDSFIFNSII